jgi:salicylate hydroxylase
LRRGRDKIMSAGTTFFKAVDSSLRKRQILIAGAGIAGLTAALTLEQRGFAVTVFEQSEDLQDEGAGVQLSPNATRLLAKIKVLQWLAASAVQIQQISLMSSAAKPLLRLDVSASHQRWRAPYLAVHRADLAAALLQEAKSRPAITIRFGSEITHFASHANGVTASVTTDRGIVEFEGVFLIGADGAWSKVRKEISSERPKFTGYVAHRRMTDLKTALPPPFRQLLEQQAIAAFLAPSAHLVAYPLRRSSVLNLVLITKTNVEPKQRGSLPKDLPATGRAGQFEGEVQKLLNSNADWTQWPIYASSRSAAWSNGKNVLLIGDAAHAMTPFGAQGAAMAIEDAWTLAACLYAHRDNLQQAPAAYENLRRARIRQVASRSALNGFAYHANGLAAKARDAVFRMRGQNMLNGLDWIYAFDASAAVV